MSQCLICGKKIDGNANALFDHIKNTHYNYAKYKCLHEDCLSKTFWNEEKENHQNETKHIMEIDADHQQYIKSLVENVCETMGKKTFRSGSTTRKGSSANKQGTNVCPKRNGATISPPSNVHPRNLPANWLQQSSSSTAPITVPSAETQILFPAGKMRKMEPSESTNYETFDEMVKKSNFISDKSLFIKHINQKNVLFGLPPGRGKTMLLTMAFAFYKLPEQQPLLRDHFNSDTAKYQFKIMEDTRLMQFHQKYPVIYISFANVEADSFEDIIIEMAEVICRAFHDYICGDDNECKNLEGDFNYFHANGTEDVEQKASKIRLHWHEGLSTLASLLRKYHNCKEKAIVLIDDYDKPMQRAILMKHITEDQLLSIQKRICRLIESTIKDRENVGSVIVMGNYRINIDLIKSYHNILDFSNTEYFYFTKEEFNQLCGHSQFKIEEPYITAAQRYYNGYKNTSREDLFLMLSTANYFNKIAGGKRASLMSTDSIIPPMECHYVEPDIIQFLIHAFRKKEIIEVIRKLAKREIVKMSYTLDIDGDRLRESIMNLREINADNRSIDKSKVHEFQKYFMRFLLANGCIIEVGVDEGRGKYMVPNEEMRDLLCSKIKSFLGTVYGIEYSLIDDLSKELFKLLNMDIDSEEKQYDEIPELNAALTNIVEKLPEFGDIRQFKAHIKNKTARMLRGNEHIIHSIVDIASLRMPGADDHIGWKDYGSDHDIKWHPWSDESMAQYLKNTTTKALKETKPDVTFLRWNGQLGITIELKYDRFKKSDNVEKRDKKMKKFLAQIGQQKYLQFYECAQNEDENEEDLKKLIAIAITVEKFDNEKPFALAVISSKNRGDLSLKEFVEQFSKELMRLPETPPERIPPTRSAKNRPGTYLQ